VLVFDNLSRDGVEENLRWLTERHAGACDVELADVRDRGAVARAIAHADRVFHLAAQVAVTTSLDEPVHDAAVNLEGTINLLEAARACRRPPTLLFTSTNKVYGDLADVAIDRHGERYEPRDEAYRGQGVSEGRGLQFSSPYGCSKGGADQYVLDYAKSYGLPAVVFRMSCIYGPHQCGNEDQGWVAHFLMRAMAGQPVTLYGDGRQVRDVLYVDDLIDAMLLATGPALDRTRGKAFNLGGGPSSTVSLLELLDTIGGLEGQQPRVGFGDWRIGDQRWYVSDTRRFADATGWAPRVGVDEGVGRLHEWLAHNRAVAEAS
jgi:CDP-paratose 2-epimerase